MVSLVTDAAIRRYRTNKANELGRELSTLTQAAEVPTALWAWGGQGLAQLNHGALAFVGGAVHGAPAPVASGALHAAAAVTTGTAALASGVAPLSIWLIYLFVRLILKTHADEFAGATPTANRAALVRLLTPVFLGHFADPQAMRATLVKHGFHASPVEVEPKGSFLRGILAMVAAAGGGVAVTAFVAANCSWGWFGALLAGVFTLGVLFNAQLQSDTGGYNYAGHQRARLMAWVLAQSPVALRWLQRALLPWHSDPPGALGSPPQSRPGSTGGPARGWLQRRLLPRQSDAPGALGSSSPSARPGSTGRSGPREARSNAGVPAAGSTARS